MWPLELKVKLPCFVQHEQKLHGLLQELTHLVCLKLVLVSQLDQLALVVALHFHELLAEHVEQVQRVQQVVELELFSKPLGQGEHPLKLEWKMQKLQQERLVYCF